MKKIISTFLCTISVFLLIPTVMADTSNYTIYVSPNGSDENDGNLGSELASLMGAKNRVRQLKNTYDNIEVIFEGGTYYFDDSVVFNAEDSAPEGGSITYKGADGEKVYFKGSKVLDKSKFTLVSDSEIMEKLPDSSKVLAVNLSEFGIVAENYTPVADGVDDYILFVDGKRQKVAGWPNGEEEYASADSYGTDKLTTWKNAGEFYISAYWSNDYNSYRKKITGSEVESVINSITSETGRFRVLHLPEELDNPGEWYIDRNKNILYYYPYEDFENSEITIAVLKSEMIKIRYTDRINFENIHFAESRGRGIFAGDIVGWDVLDKSESVNIKNCIFSGFGYTAIHCSGINSGVVESGDYERDSLNYWTGVKDWTIDGNCFYDLSYGAIILDAGAITPLVSGECVIKNNYIYNTNISSVNHAAIWLRHGVGNVVENNIIHHVPYHAVTYNGNNQMVKRNELYNANRHTIDCGVVYTGRSFYQRGGIVEENYIHDSNPVDTTFSKSNNAIYFDDTIGGQTARNNLIVNVQRGVTVNGSQGNTVDGNIMYGCEYNTHLNDMFLTNESIINMKDKDFGRMTYSPGFLDEYPETLEIYNNYKTEFALNKVQNNIMRDGKLYIAKTENNTILNNQILDNDADFEGAVDARNGLFSFSNGTFNVSNVGIIENSILNDVIYQDFKVILPVNSQSITWYDTCRFEWENATGADSYRVEFAKDEGFSDIVYSKASDYNFCDIRLTMSTGNYYWRVVAVNESEKLSDEWTSNIGTITVTGWL